MKCNYNLQDYQQQQSVTRAGLPLSLEWPEVLIYFSVTLSNSLVRIKALY